MQLFSDNKGNIHAIDLTGIKPVFTFNYYSQFVAQYYVRSYYHSHQFYRHPRDSSVYAKLTVTREDGVHKTTTCELVTKSEFVKFVDDHKLFIRESGIGDLIREGIVDHYPFEELDSTAIKYSDDDTDL